MSTDQFSTLSWAHPLVRDWFIHKFASPTEPQIQGWPFILAAENTLISAPTGSGKTLAAFLICIDRLVRQALAGELTAKTTVLYVSPLKALSNDIQKNLAQPLAEISALAEQQGLTMADIQIAVRTGDTPARERQAMLKKPPQILVTTPESLYILLTAEKSRIMLMDVETVIVDEIHAMANDKRGAHLALSLERLAALTQKPLLRIGLSATQKPLSTVGHFLVGNNHPTPKIVNIGHAKQLDLAIEIPASELGPITANEMWDEIYDRLAALAQENRSTLIFTNTRRLAERIAHHLSERLGEDQVAAHHGSLSRKLRLAAENKLKNGELKALVATASLELGIDIGSIDLVCQIGSPRAIAVALQRVGRAGHWRGAISKGRFFAGTLDELLECAALIYAIRAGDLDQLIIPQQPLDILAQQIIACCATSEWQEEDLYHLLKGAYHYRDLDWPTFNGILDMLSEGIAGSRGRYSAFIYRDRVNHILRGRRGSRLTAITNGGAIPDNGLFTVICEPENVMVGTLDEDFAVESNRGDIILLGTTSWQIQRVESSSGKVIVEDAHGAPPSVPFWRGEAPARTIELSAQLSALRQKISDILVDITPVDDWHDQSAVIEAQNWLQTHCGVNEFAAKQCINYILQGRAILGAVPTQHRVIAERFFDEGGGMQLVIHAPFGARINKAWGLALRKRFCRSFNFELQAAATDNGLNISLAEQHSFPLADVFRFLHPNSLKEVLCQAILQSPLFHTRWRWDASRALALPRFRNGRKLPPNIQRMLADDLLAAVFPDAAACQDNLGGRDIELPDHPLITETMKDALNEALDFEGLKSVIEGILAERIEALAVDTPTPSVFSHEILNANPYAFLDDAPLEERRARAVEMRRTLPESVLREAGRLNPAAIQEVQQQAWPDIRNADEMHDALQTFIALPAEFNLGNNRELSAEWQAILKELAGTGRAGIASYSDRTLWLATEKTRAFTAAFPEAVLEHSLPDIPQALIEPEEAVLQLLRGWLFHLGPTSQQELCQLLGLKPDEVMQALLKLENSGLILRGHFLNSENSSELQWCERRLLARIHQLTLSQLRQEIQPVTPRQFLHWLAGWQHLQPNSQLRGEKGLLEVISQLQGFEIPANAWEKQILAARVSDYDPGMLDRLCFAGAIGWGRLSAHPLLSAPSAETPDKPAKLKRAKPSSTIPITFFLREHQDWMPNSNVRESLDLKRLGHPAQKIYQHLQHRGASFFPDIVRQTRLLEVEAELGLWELVTLALATADGFDNLRALIDPRRRNPRKRHYLSQPRFSIGRWSLLATPEFNAEKHIEASCWMLLRRYGLVFRELLSQETLVPRWRELLPEFRRLEDRGEVRGGRFISGVKGEQFALPYVVESLRNLRKQKNSGAAEEAFNISPFDPLNLSVV